MKKKISIPMATLAGAVFGILAIGWHVATSTDPHQNESVGYFMGAALMAALLFVLAAAWMNRSRS